MPLSTGTKLGPYEILESIGAGGMGEVYRAKDTQLKRDVAVKILPDSFAADPERMARFQREAEVLASLNHPNIAAIYGVAESGATRALVMELVDGVTLPTGLPLDTALPYARQIAEALEYAHERGVVHRDLKPANVRVTYDGAVKLLDFGLAKAIDDPSMPSGDPVNSPTLTLGATRVGTILGTAAYMSPEQASGKTADRRADIWSFGAVLYEMLTGKRAFAGESAADTLASVMKLDADWTALPAGTPATIRNLIRRCLTKDRKQRLQAIGEARIAIDATIGGNPSPQNAATPPEVPWLWSGVAAAMAILAGISLWGWLRPTPPEPRSVVRISTNLPVTAGNGTFALSRDGSRLAYVSGPHRQIYVRMMDQLDAKALPGTEAASFLCFSPDGQWISFVTQPPALKLEKIALAGGPPQVIADFGGSSVAPVHSWGPDNNILIAVSGALLRIPASGGQAQTLATPDPKTNEVGFAGAQLLPGGKEILVRIARLGSADIAALNIESGKRKILVERASVSLLRFLPTGPGASAGHIVYSAPSIGSLMAVPFDASRVEVKGSPVPVVDGLQGLNSGPLWAVSDSGTLVYVAGSPRAVTALVWVDRKGVEQPVPAPARNYFTLSLSPDGQRVALVAPGEKTEMWVYDIARGTSLKIASSRDGGLPVWTPDGKRIIYRQIPNEIAWAPADNSGPPTLLANMEKGGAPTPTSVSPDGKMLAGFYGTGEVLWVLPLTEGSTGDSKPQSLVDSQPGKRDPHFSPDGQWVAYRTSETGVNEVYVAPYPGPGAKFPISPGGGAQPRWSHDGRELFYRTQDPSQVLAVDIQTTPSFRAGTPKVLFEEHGSYAQFYDVSPDGKRFLMVKRPDSAQPSAIQATVVLNWFEELRLRAPVGK